MCNMNDKDIFQTNEYEFRQYIGKYFLTIEDGGIKVLDAGHVPDITLYPAEYFVEYVSITKHVNECGEIRADTSTRIIYTDDVHIYLKHPICRDEVIRYIHKLRKQEESDFEERMFDMT